MRILIATGIYPPDIGGPATYSKLLNDELPKRGVGVSVLSFGEVRQLPKIVSHIAYFFKAAVRSRKADIIFAQDTVSVALPAMLVAKLLRKRFFVRVPGDYAWEQAVQRFGVTDTIDAFQEKRYDRKTERLRSIQRLVVNAADTVITPSLYFKQLVSKWVREPQKVICIYNGIDLSDIPSPTGSFVPKTIVSAGRLVPWKGFIGLMKALKELPGWKLSIAGEGPMRKELENAAAELGVADRVEFEGQIPRSELIALIQRSEIFVLNTSFESFSFQVVETMAAGTPVIATNIGNLAEIVNDEGSGLLVAPDDVPAIVSSINRLSSDKGLRARLVAEAKKKAAQFSIERTLDALLKAFDKKP
jgi:glycosyltransferase involved in cell wall biosynthesis